MASKRRLRRQMQRRSCQRKRRYDTISAAETAVRCLVVRQQKDPSRARAGWLHPYQCKFCGGWHVGHSKGATAMLRLIDTVMGKDH